MRTIVSGDDLHGSEVVVSWDPQSSGGSPITGYKVYLQTADGSFNSENTQCAYTVHQATVLVNTACQIAITRLMQAPFNHVYGASIKAKVIATNFYGDSGFSELGNGAVIVTYADAPASLVEDTAKRAATTLALSWLTPIANGGATVLDYTVSYD